SSRDPGRQAQGRAPTLDRAQRLGECRHPRRHHAMKLLSHLSPNGDGLPRPADTRLLTLGLSAWDAALAEAQDKSCAALAQEWSATAPGRGLLAAIFGNSPFLSGLAITEWSFLTRIVEEGADALFEDLVTATETYADSGENRAM